MTPSFSPKATLRRTIREHLKTLTARERQQRSREISQRIAALPAWQGAGRIGSFSALPDEPDLALLLALREGRRYCLPKINGEELLFLDVCGVNDLEISRWGLLEPVYREEAIVPPGQIDLLLVPGVAFTAEGYRMGRGRGYYDRFLAQPGFCGATAGVCFREQLVDELPIEAHDRPVNEVIAG